MKKINAKLSKLLNTKKKRNIFAVALVALIGVIGVTIAYFATTTAFKNIFKTTPFNVTVYEIFESPDNWTPGTTTPKEVYATNNSNVDVAVRISYEEEWVAQDGTELSLEQDGNRAAIINLTNQEDWGQSGGYFYYRTDLKPGETTTSFMESVTFNPEIVGSYTCTKNDEGHEVCTSDGTGYDGATYTLTIIIEMLQADAKEEVWGDIYLCPDPLLYTGEELISDTTDADGYYVTDDYLLSVDTTTNTASIVSYTGATGDTADVKIPMTINGVSITSIKEGAFSDKTFNSITMSPNIETAEVGSFENVVTNNFDFDYASNLLNFNFLTSVTINNDLVLACSPKATDFNSSNVAANTVTVKNLTSLQRFMVPALTTNNLVLDNLNSLNNVFSSSSKIGEIHLTNSSIETIPGSAFNNVGATEIELKNLPNLKSTQNMCFANNNVQELILEDLPSLETIGYGTFEATVRDNLIIRNLPKLKLIDQAAFFGMNAVDENDNLIGVKTLTLENLPSLETIGLSAFAYNRIEDLNIVGLTALKEIKGNAFNVNQISEVEASGMPALEEIWHFAFGENPIKKIDLTGAKALTTLFGNTFVSTLDSIESVDISNLENLETIDETSFSSEGMLIEYMNASGSVDDSIWVNLNFGVKYKTLDISNNTITDISWGISDTQYAEKLILTNSSALTSLYLNGSKYLTELDVSNSPVLTQVDLNSLPIEKLNLANAAALTSLDFSKLEKLKELDISNIPLIKQLEFSNIPIEKINVSGDTGITSVVITGTNLVDLDLSTLESLEYLDIKGGSLFNSINLSGLKKLATINIVSTTVSDFNLDEASGVSSLSLTNTGIKELDLTDLYSLTSISIIANENLTKLKFGNSPNLTAINQGSLIRNRIDALDFAPLTNLTTLGVDGEYHTKIRIPASVTTITGAHSMVNLECVEILGDSTRFDDTFQSIFGPPKSYLASTCTFE